MSIVPLLKVSLLGPLREKRTILKSLQELGKIHLQDLSVTKTQNGDSKSHAQLSEQLKKAIRYLDEAATKTRQDKDKASFNLVQTIAAVLANQQQRRELADRIDELREREKTLAPWGNFTLPVNEQLLGYQLWFYLLPSKHAPLLEQINVPWQIIHRDHRQLWLVLISRDEPPGTILPCERVQLGTESLEEVRKALLHAQLSLDNLDLERQKLTRYLSLLKRFRARAEDLSALSSAQRNSLDIEQLFLVQGWLPINELPTLQDFAREYRLALHSEAIAPDDEPPTLMRNPELLRGGELLAHFYQTPAYGSWDPSVLLFISFAAFFAMILSDAGYAAVLAGFLAGFWRKLGKLRTGRLLRPLLVSIIALSLLWGILVGSYFGRSPPANSVLAALQLLDLKHFNQMMALSIGMGIAHLCIANIYQIIHGWGTARAILHSGWILVLLAGASYGFVDGARDEFAEWVYAAGGGGLAMIFIGGGTSSMNSLKNIAWRLVEGLQALTQVTSLFGDILSYLRLFALGLASASLALTFNGLANDAFASGSSFSILAGTIILVIGHTLNLALSIISGVVHGLRLNFIEFYRWALYGEGYPFKAFQKREYGNE